MIDGVGNVPCEERLEDLGMFSQKKRRLRRDLVAMFNSIKGSYGESDQEGPEMVVSCNY